MKQPIDVFRAFRQSMLSGSDEWMNLISDNVSLIGPLAEVEGKQSFIAVNKPFFSSIRGSELLEVKEIGAHVITQITTDVEGPTGKVVTLHVSEWYRIEGGRIQSLKVYFDTAPLLPGSQTA